MPAEIDPFQLQEQRKQDRDAPRRLCALALVLLVAGLKFRAASRIGCVQIRRTLRFRLFQLAPALVLGLRQGAVVGAAQFGDLVLGVAILAFKRGLMGLLLDLDRGGVLFAQGSECLLVLAANARHFDLAGVFQGCLLFPVPFAQHFDLGRVAGVEAGDLGLHLGFTRGLFRFPVFAQAHEFVLVRFFVLGKARFQVVAYAIQLQPRAVFDGGKTLLDQVQLVVGLGDFGVRVFEPGLEPALALDALVLVLRQRQHLLVGVHQALLEGDHLLFEVAPRTLVLAHAILVIENLPILGVQGITQVEDVLLLAVDGLAQPEEILLLVQRLRLQMRAQVVNDGG